MISKQTDGAIVCAGRVYCDLIFTGLTELPRLGEETYAEELAVEPGGGGFITAANLSALGHKTTLLASMPGGPFGSAILDKMQRSGVDLSLSPFNTTNGAQVTAVIGCQEDRAFLTKRNGTAVPRDMLDAFSTSKARHLHIGELATLQELPELLEIAKAAGMTVSLDCSWDQNCLLNGNVQNLIAQVDLFLPNEMEAEHLGYLKEPANCPTLTVVKKGKAGATAITKDGEITVAADPVPVVDTTGAGDAFNAGFLSSWLRGADIKTCLHDGNKCGAAAVMRIGGAP
ncbi:sugar kinase [Pseudovibrio sp. Ad26]|uniref:carbohydrate kinase family protein n=1 Tax=Pseudovibrio sp. Ad26 TaxID=989410 RepID=UPI0007AE8480|nr:sugar kinase [Pseudovibrio sp. Ad26]KZL06575.1 putative sugar kinase YdjH [Pseudovibrio sp. Ad26]